MVQFAGCPPGRSLSQVTDHDVRRVAPFGDPGIDACLPLPPAFRRSLRPSSASGPTGIRPAPYSLVSCRSSVFPAGSFLSARREPPSSPRTVPSRERPRGSGRHSSEGRASRPALRCSLFLSAVVKVPPATDRSAPPTTDRIAPRRRPRHGSLRAPPRIGPPGRPKPPRRTGTLTTGERGRPVSVRPARDPRHGAVDPSVLQPVDLSMRAALLTRSPEPGLSGARRGLPRGRRAGRLP